MLSLSCPARLPSLTRSALRRLPRSSRSCRRSSFSCSPSFLLQSCCRATFLKLPGCRRAKVSSTCPCPFPAPSLSHSNTNSNVTQTHTHTHTHTHAECWRQEDCTADPLASCDVVTHECICSSTRNASTLLPLVVANSSILCVHGNIASCFCCSESGPFFVYLPCSYHVWLYNQTVVTVQSSSMSASERFAQERGSAICAKIEKSRSSREQSECLSS